MEIPDTAQFYIKNNDKIVFYRELICPNLGIKLLEYFNNGKWETITRGYVPWKELNPIVPTLNFDI